MQSAGNRVDELVLLPGAVVAAWQLCVLASKVTSTGRLSKITVKAGSTLIPNLSEVDETQVTIPRTKVDILSIESEISIDDIDYLTRHMDVDKLQLINIFSLYLHVSLYIPLGNYMGDVVAPHIYMYHFIYPLGIIWVMLLFIIFTCVTLYTLGELYG